MNLNLDFWDDHESIAISIIDVSQSLDVEPLRDINIKSHLLININVNKNSVNK